jgi:magnesium-transporting ATPase (P-type)
VYRMAASAILVLVLSIIAFVDGCAVDSLLIILLALFNDISMLPVAYDRADATSKPQLPHTMKLLAMSLYYGLLHTSLSLVFIFSISYSSSSWEQDVNLALCNEETRGFVWMHLVLVSELTIFSVRAPSYFWRSMPSIWLIASVFATCIGCCFIAVFASQLSPRNLLWIWLFNIGSFIIADIGKVQFRGMIGDAPGEIIESDELVSVVAKESDMEKFQDKQKRYVVHRDAAMDPADFQHCVRVGRRNSMFDLPDSLTEGIRFTQPGARLHYLSSGQDSGVVRRRMKMASAPDLKFRY